MSGHSKWSQIKRQKGAADAKRSQAFAKIANLITLAARHGADPSMNFQLRIAVDRARAANMPKDNIERAIERASGANATKMEEVIFEAYGPEGVAYLIETATDNRNRTTGDIRAVLNKHGGKMAEAGSVSYLFKQRGVLTLPFLKEKQDDLELAIIDAGAEDYTAEEEKVYVFTNPKELDKVRQSLISAGFTIEEAALEWEPIAPVVIENKDTAQKLINLAQALEDLDDVSHVGTNFEVHDTVELE